MKKTISLTLALVLALAGSLSPAVSMMQGIT